ncbi:LuxR C-terminal-related transcriptional regulator [Streptomyces collinus]|uniref:ATP-binding protein n=1 Tax=Streptomyces collinus TaxID=42684 RepID=UPI00340FB65E
MTPRGSGAGNLPAPLTSFVGRRRELAEVRRLLGTTRLLTLTGVGGVGKTRLALEAAAASTEDLPDGAWLVDLAAVRDPSLVADATATALGLPDVGAGAVIDQLAVSLAHRALLIVLDNCEHLVDACAELAHVLLSASPGLRVLATSRRALGIFGEHLIVVPPLAQADAVELLRDRTIAVRPGFQVTDGNHAEVRRLCGELDGLPLAIELAAYRLRTLSVTEVANRLEDRFGLLTSGNRIARPHQRTLRALMDWSHELCTPAERLLWSRLSVFVGDFSLDAAEAVCAGDGIGGDEVLDLLDRLVVQSVALPRERDGLPRYRLLETVRQYGRERLVEAGEEQRMLRRHQGFYLSFAEGIADGWHGPGQLESVTRVSAEHANLRAALARGGDPQATLALTAALRFHWCEGGHVSEGRRWLDRALAAAPEPTPVRARALWVAAWVAALQRDLEAAHRLSEEARDLGEWLGDPVVCAHVQSLRGTLAVFGGRLDEAVPFFEAAVAAHTDTGDEIGALYALLQLGFAQSRLGDPHAQQICSRAVALAEAHGERRAHVLALWALGNSAWLRGDPDEASALLRTALEKAQGFNDSIKVALMLEELAWATSARGDHKGAGRLLGAARTLLRDAGTVLSTFGPHMVEQHDRCEDGIVRSLGRPAYEEAIAEGANHSGPDKAIAYALRSRPEPVVTAPAPSPLTPREQNVAALVAKGMSNRQIASALERSPRTVDGHVENILAKLDFKCRAQIASWWTANTPSLPTATP